MNSIHEMANDIQKDEYVFCPIEGHYLYFPHLETCDANHTVWA